VTYDGAAWGALACSLSALGAVLTYVAWQRRGAGALVRGAAWTLLPLAAWLTGTLKLLTEVLGDVGDWAVDLVFSPRVWLGICLAGVSAVLFGVSAFVRGRRSPAPASKKARGGRRGGALPRSRGGTGAGSAGSTGAEGVDGMDEIDAILRKHGIS
jgi:hypothetical protein